jgi:hypothetical protein
MDGKVKCIATLVRALLPKKPGLAKVLGMAGWYSSTREDQEPKQESPLNIINIVIVSPIINTSVCSKYTILYYNSNFGCAAASLYVVN